jgi:hypothetical protein
MIVFFYVRPLAVLSMIFLVLLPGFFKAKTYSYLGESFINHGLILQETSHNREFNSIDQTLFDVNLTMREAKVRLGSDEERQLPPLQPWIPPHKWLSFEF